MHIFERVEAYENSHLVIPINYKGVTLLYRIPNRTALWRAMTLTTKEPSTIAWLNNIDPDSILLDVGADAGMYSIFAAKVRGARVYAFEPESQNYALLNANVQINNLGSQITAYCAELSDKQGLDTLYLSEFALGSSHHSLGEEVGFDLKPRPSPFTQGAISFSLDEMVQDGTLPVPNYIKIDVGGLEHKVLLGGRKTLSDPRVISVIVELNPAIPAHHEVVTLLNELGFRHNEIQVNAAARKNGDFKGAGEWIFSRRANDEYVSYAGAPSFLEQTEDTRQFARHLVGRIKDAKIETDPFPHVIVQNVFPDDYYAEIQRHFPADDQMIPLSETGRTGNSYRERLVTLFDESGFGRLTVEQRRFWGQFGGWLYSPEFMDGVIKMFWPHVKTRIHEVSQLLGWTRLRGDAQLVSDQTNYGIGPHTDAAHRLVTLLFYMPQDDWFRNCGTSIYTPKNPEFSCKGGQHYPYDLFSHKETIPFLPNTLLMFVRTANSFHGVEPIREENITRHLLINNIRLVDV